MKKVIKNVLFISLFLNVICIVSYGETKNEITSLEGKWKYIGRVDKKLGMLLTMTMIHLT